MTTQIPDWLNAVGEGWRPILLQLHEEILKENPYYNIDQVKEKFGGLRVYLISRESSAIRDAIFEAEATSFVTCEKCGKPGETGPIRPNGYWVKTLCTHCRDHWDKGNDEEEPVENN